MLDILPGIQMFMQIYPSALWALSYIHINCSTADGITSYHHPSLVYYSLYYIHNAIIFLVKYCTYHLIQEFPMANYVEQQLLVDMRLKIVMIYHWRQDRQWKSQLKTRMDGGQEELMKWKVSFPVTTLRNQIKACNIILYIIHELSLFYSGSAAIVTYSYEAEDSDELSLEVGQTVEILAEYESGWSIGRVNGVEGVFPSNYVKELDKGM